MGGSIKIILVGLKITVITVLFSSCASVGSKTLYRVDHKINLEKIGYAPLDFDTTFVHDNLVSFQVYSNASNIYSQTLSKALKSNGYINGNEIHFKVSFSNTNKQQIINICNANNLDGLIVSKLIFINIIYYPSYSPIMKDYDTEVEMELYDKNGELQISTKHNTFIGNSYMLKPTTNKIIHDGTMGAFNRIMKEIKKTK
jgi:hypothetical protein